MTAFPLPANLVASVGQDGDERRRRWVSMLPGLVGELAARWGLRVGEPFQPGGQTSWVAPAADADGASRVLKVGFHHRDSEHEAAGLRLWADRGAVRVHEAYREGDTSALLLERCVPGTELGHRAAEPEQDEVVAGLLTRMWGAPAPGHPFRDLAAMCDEWATEYEETPNPDLDPGLAREGLDLFRSLPASADRRVVLLTDLHAGNVLAAEREPWLVIDPKPHVGDPAYDPLQHLLNCRERLLADPHALADRMAALCGLDVGRFRLWLFARCVVESAWWPPLHRVARALAPR